MSTLTIISALAGVFVATYLLSGLLKRHAVALQLIDIPNERSSHSTPVPRGGGVALALVFLLSLALLYSFTFSHSPLSLSLLIAGGLITVIGFIDDRDHIPVRIRLVAHFSAAFLVVYLIYIHQQKGLLTLSAEDWAVTIMLTLCLVWLLNLYNFMDGIDAITGSETLSVSLSAATLSWLLLPQDPAWLILLLLASCVAGFLAWNLPPARLFMGDAGSAFIGIVLGIMVIHAYQVSIPLFFAWIILLGVYVVDATTTLFRRILSGEKFYQAHRSHAYQHAAIRLSSHGRVSLAIGLINLFWLFPFAAAVALEMISGPLAVALSYLPLILAALYYNAGRKQDR